MRRVVFYLLLTLFTIAHFDAAWALQKQKSKTPKPKKTQPDSQPQKNQPPPNNTDAKPEGTKPAAGADDQWALIVGVSDYPGQIQKLGFPNKDARAIKDLL